MKCVIMTDLLIKFLYDKISSALVWNFVGCNVYDHQSIFLMTKCKKTPFPLNFSLTFGERLGEHHNNTHISEILARTQQSAKSSAPFLDGRIYRIRTIWKL